MRPKIFTAKQNRIKRLGGERDAEGEEEDLRRLLDDLLDIVLAETAVPDVVDLADKGDRLGLAHSHHPDPIRRPAGPLSSLLHPG